MFARKWTKSRVYDMIHRSVVGVLMGATAAGTLYLVVQAGKYMVFTRPESRKERRLAMENQVAQEQTEKEEELMQKQKEAELRL